MRGFYVGYRDGFIHELLRVVSYLVTIVGTLFLVETVSQLLTMHTFLNVSTARVVTFCVLLIVLFLLAKVFQFILVKMLKAGEGGMISRLFGAALGGVRLLFMLSFLFMAVDAFPPLKQLQADVHKRSLTGDTVAQAAPTLMEFMAQLSPKLVFPK